ncbi:MAG: M48 family metallopeptidase [Ruminococcaceae bacterium]|nr:M48 family metallopeptidase [Oscillospiraceae bacterium]
MIVWGAILLAFLGSLYTMVLNIVQYRSANNPTPESVADVYDAETYQTWKRYSAEHCRLDIVSTVFSFVLTVALLATKVYAAFASLFPDTVMMQLLAVVLLETVCSTVLNTVFRYIGTMVIEQKYGFNRSTKKTFVLDTLRSLLLSFLLSYVLVVLMAVLHRAMGDGMILLFAAAVFLITLLISFLYPIFSRIGNTFTPLEDGELKERLLALLSKHGYRVKAIEVMDASRRTTKLNAYFTGFGKLKTIVLYDNLVNAMSVDEICAVFAHELGHGLHKDVLKRQILNVGNLLLMAVVVWLAVREPMLHTAFGFETVNYGFAYILVGLGLGLVQPLTGMVMNAYSRAAEYRADRQAVQEGYGGAMICALKKLAKDNFAHLAPSRLNVVMEYSHPPLGERVARVEEEMRAMADPSQVE